MVRKLSSSMMFVLEKRRPATFRMDTMPLIVRPSATSCTTFRSRAVSIKPCFALCCMECFTEVLTSAASAQSSHPGCDSSIVCKLTVPRSGIAGLVPHKRGPKEARKLTNKIIDFLQQIRLEDPSLGSAELVGRIKKRFGVIVHPRTIERGLARHQKKRRKSG